MAQRISAKVSLSCPAGAVICRSGEPRLTSGNNVNNNLNNPRKAGDGFAIDMAFTVLRRR
ncbi:hypothetical protein ACFL54_03550 [Planctomycetota bacterium]